MRRQHVVAIHEVVVERKNDGKEYHIQNNIVPPALSKR
jgi:hypothetical protein